MDPGAEQDQEGCQVGFQEGTGVLPGGTGGTVLDLDLRQPNMDQVGQEGPLVLEQLEVQGLGQKRGLGPELGRVLEVCLVGPEANLINMEVQDLHLALAQEWEEMALCQEQGETRQAQEEQAQEEQAQAQEEQAQEEQAQEQEEQAQEEQAQEQEVGYIIGVIAQSLSEPGGAGGVLEGSGSSGGPGDGTGLTAGALGGGVGDTGIPIIGVKPDKSGLGGTAIPGGIAVPEIGAEVVQPSDRVGVPSGGAAVVDITGVGTLPGAKPLKAPRGDTPGEGDGDTGGGPRGVGGGPGGAGGVGSGSGGVGRDGDGKEGAGGGQEGTGGKDGGAVRVGGGPNGAGGPGGSGTGGGGAGVGPGGVGGGAGPGSSDKPPKGSGAGGAGSLGAGGVGGAGVTGGAGLVPGTGGAGDVGVGTPKPGKSYGAGGAGGVLPGGGLRYPTGAGIGLGSGKPGKGTFEHFFSCLHDMVLANLEQEDKVLEDMVLDQADTVPVLEDTALDLVAMGPDPVVMVLVQAVMGLAREVMGLELVPVAMVLGQVATGLGLGLEAMDPSQARLEVLGPVVLVEVWVELAAMVL
ncbi:hypothetical protein J4Q44_G00119660 [Coregonus suidteri]|uniref:Uncharacterized protein n=1 Tax=Coregonus suidteri TaxID=861788 RepID=A0AAN8QYA0_9TELE